MEIKRETTAGTPLLRQWTFWYLIPDRFTIKSANWDEFLHRLADFETIEEFWGILNSIEKASLLPKGCRYYVFKRGIRPLWEDRNNAGGIELSIEHVIAKSKKEKINDRFEDVVLSLIGETIAHSEHINGIEFTIRTDKFRMNLWVSATGKPFKDEISADLLKLARWKAQVTTSDIKPESN